MNHEDNHNFVIIILNFKCIRMYFNDIYTSFVEKKIINIYHIKLRLISNRLLRSYFD